MKVKCWLFYMLALAILAIPATAENNGAKTDAGSAAADSGSAVSTSAATSPSPSLPSQASDANVSALLSALVKKGVLTPTDANAIRNASPTAQFQALVEALNRKGILSATDLNAVEAPAAHPSALAAGPAAVPERSLAIPEPMPAPLPFPDTPPTPRPVVAAVAPVRVLPVDPPKKDGLVPAFKMGAVKMTPYGFIKATAAYDSSSPNGDDFPFVGLFLGSTSVVSTGPNKDPEFHVKARSTRFGTNIEWPDISPKLTFTGRIEGDYEGNYSEVDNRDVSSIRSNAFQLRLAYVRMDYAASEKTDIFFEGGQDWTLFGSSALPNILETTFLGAYYGDVYERSPQMRLGLVQKLGGSRNLKFSPEFAIMMPSTGQIEKLGSLGLAGQLAQAERQGADSGQPEWEARAVLQFQLDKAPGVAPAQLIWSGFYAKRTSIVANSALVPVNATSLPAGVAALYAGAYPNGFTTSSNLYGNQIALQLPTRWMTVVASGYFGGDLRFFFGGQVNTYFTDTGGLTNVAVYQTLDGGPLAASGAAALATNRIGQVVIAPQKPIRAFGGFVNVGFPLSRWFNANPKGHNAGWQLYLHMGKDQVLSKDLSNPAGFNANPTNPANGPYLAPLPLRMGKVFAGTLYYKVNPWCTFAVEQSVYATRLDANGPLPDYTIAGKLSNEWQDHRTEFGPVFTF